MQSFSELNLPQGLRNNLQQMKFETPTPIQAQAIPPALEGRDVLGTAQTGTGKTGAFGVPLAARLMTQSRGSALVLTPTRELAVQVLDALKNMTGKTGPIKSALLIGGESMPKQLQELRARPRLLVGTPGRINDHLERGSLMLHDANFLVLDEMDRMLDMGFGIQLDAIVKFLPAQRQTLMFSATMPDNIIKLSNKYLSNPVRVSVGDVNKATDAIDQQVIHTTDDEKFNQLLKELDTREGTIIVFVKTKWSAQKMAEKLAKKQYSAAAIHGDLRQNQRDRVIAEFRNRKHRILVATDIAARGLDIPHIEHVINFDLPMQPEDYIHRIGRTARAGAKGEAVCFVTTGDALKWRAIQLLMNPDVKLEPLAKGEGPRKRNRNRNRSKEAGAGRDRSEGGAREEGGRSNKKGGFGKRPAGNRFESRGEGRNESRGEGRPQRKDRGDFAARPAREHADRSDRPARRDDARRDDARRDGARRDDNAARPAREHADRSDRPARSGARRDDARREGARRDGARRDDNAARPAREHADRSDRPARSGARRDDARRDDARRDDARRDGARRDGARKSVDGANRNGNGGGRPRFRKSGTSSAKAKAA